jgi:hypothetical protein
VRQKQQFRIDGGIDPMRIMPIVHYDGTPITARFIAKVIGALKMPDSPHP